MTHAEHDNLVNKLNKALVAEYPESTNNRSLPVNSFMVIEAILNELAKLGLLNDTPHAN